MASTGGGKIRSKRSKGASKPYARRTSFLGRVSDTVKDFITPSWLSNMWQSGDEPGDTEQPHQQQQQQQLGGHGSSNAIPQYSFAPPHSRRDEFDEEEEQKEGEEVDMPEQATTHRDVELETIEEDAAMQAEQQRRQQPSTSSGQHKTPFNRYTKPLGASTPNDDDIQIIAERKAPDIETASDTSVSTSGCSSLMPHLDKADHREKLSQFNLDRLSEMGRGSPRFRSDSPRHQRFETPRGNTSLWSETSRTSAFGSSSGSSRPQQPAQSSRRPTFNSSYFCTPRGGNSSFGNTSITTTDSPGGRSSSFTSPFYPGKTTFGGSSAQRRAKRPRTSPYEVHLPVKRHVKIRPSSRNEADVTSQTAKRILETLEKMSTPLSDAKKIPLSPSSSPFSFTPGRAAKMRRTDTTSRAPGLQERGVRIPGPPTSGIRIPEVASIAQNRQPTLPSFKRESKRESAIPATVSKPPTEESTASSEPQSAGFSFGPSTSTTAPARTQAQDRTAPSYGEPRKSSGKMRSSKREQHYKSPLRDEQLEEFDLPLPPNIALPLANGSSLPNFTSIPLMSSTPAPLSSTGTPAGGFTFSIPISKKTTSESLQTGAPAGAPSGQSELFKFSNPKPKQPSVPATKTPAVNFSATSPKMPFNPVASPPKAEPMEDEIEVIDDEDEENQDFGGGGFKVAKELKKGSCLDFLGIVSKPNKESTDAKPKVSSGSTSKTSNAPLGLLFKKTAGTWSCDSCMADNKPEDNKCACCTTPKPGGSATTTSKPPSSLFGGQQSSVTKPLNSLSSASSKPPLTNSGFGNQFKPAAGSWECDTCMLQNKGDVTKCAACETPKPGATSAAPVNSISSAPSLAAAAPSLGFGDKFKPAAGSWTCDTCMLANKATVSKCVACETPKPGSQQTLSAPPASAYKFGSSAVSSSDSSSKPILGSLPPGGFNFGASQSTNAKDAAAPAIKPFAFGQSTTDDSAKSSSKPSGFKPLPAGGFNFGGATAAKSSKTNNESNAPPPNADPFKSGAFNATETTKPATVNFATVSSEPKVSNTPTKPAYTFGASSDKKDNADTPVVNFGGSASNVEQTKPSFNFGGGPKTDAVVNQTSKPTFNFGAGGASNEQQKQTSTPFAFGGTDSTTAISKPPSEQPKAIVTESAANKPLFNFKSANSSTTFQFGSSSNSTVEPKPAETKPAPAYSFTASASSKPATENSKPPTFNFGGTTAKPAENKDAGSTNSIAKAPAGSFVFGAGNTSEVPSTNPGNTTTPAASVTPFTFGGDTAAPKQNSGTFVFGGAPASTTSQPTAPSTGGFTFNATATTQQAAPAFGASNAASNSVFGGFGSNSSSANPSPVFGNSAPATTATSVPNFGTTAATPFGTQNQQQQGAVAPAFGAANSGTPFGGTTAPAFGSGATPAFGASNPAPAFGGTNNTTASPFGNNTVQQNNTAFPASNATAQPFQFGAAANAQAPQQNSGGVFKFGGAQNNDTSQNSAPSGFNFGAAQSAAPSGYNFSATPTAAAPGAGSAYNFNASAGGTPASNPFNPTPTSSSTHSGRKIKRAVRRNPRK